jgi:hypothetical protein
MTPDIDADDAEDRIRSLMDDREDLISITRTGASEAAAYYAVVRSWPHPDESGLRIVNIQNVQLVAEWSDMSDTFLSGGYRQRVPDGNGDIMRSLASALAGAAAQADAGSLGSREVSYEDASGVDDG